MRRLLLCAFGAIVPMTSPAQGSLSGVGFGYPGGQLSARARATGGALGEFDPMSALNPAVLAGWDRSGLFFQYEPEYRRTVVAGEEDWIRLQRFPLVALGLRFRSGLVLSIGASSLLDRRWETSIERADTLGGNTVSYVEETRATGAITDIRFGAGWSRGERLLLGGAVHAYTGEHDFQIVRSYSTSGFGTFNELVNRAYSGFALSTGAEFRLSPAFAIAGSYRKGFTMKSYKSDTVTAEGRVPDRIAGAVRYGGITGLTLGATLSWTKWSAFDGLLRDGTKAHDALEFGIGVEAAGPRWFDESIPVRAGLRTRTLPFTQGFDIPREYSAAAGFGLPIARGRAMLDFGAEWARRTSTTDGCLEVGCTVPPYDVRERTWTFSFGVTVRQ